VLCLMMTELTTLLRVDFEAPMAVKSHSMAASRTSTGASGARRDKRRRRRGVAGGPFPGARRCTVGLEAEKRGGGDRKIY
jgi:hypothetical protein